MGFKAIFIAALLSANGLVDSAPVAQLPTSLSLPIPTFTGTHTRPTGSFTRPTGSFTGLPPRPTGSFTGRPTFSLPPSPTAVDIKERDEIASTSLAFPGIPKPTGSFSVPKPTFTIPKPTFSSIPKPTGSFSFTRPTGRPTGSFSIPKPTGSFTRPTGVPTFSLPPRPTESGEPEDPEDDGQVVARQLPTGTFTSFPAPPTGGFPTGLPSFTGTFPSFTGTFPSFTGLPPRPTGSFTGTFPSFTGTFPSFTGTFPFPPRPTGSFTGLPSFSTRTRPVIPTSVADAN